MMRVTVGCQLDILMTIEGLIDKGFDIVSANTDGFDALVPIDRKEEFFSLCKYYEEKMGNKEMGNFEYTHFAWIVQTSVNDYVAKKLGVYDVVDGKVVYKKDEVVSKESMYPSLKMKGDFQVEFELHKNSSNRVVPLALVKYFYEQVKPEDFVNNHQDIFDFCARSNVGSSFYHIGYKNNRAIHLPKLIRYYAAKKGYKIWKMVRDDCTTNAHSSQIAAEARFKVVCNTLYPKDWGRHLSNVNRQYYIDKIREIIYKVETGKRIRKIKINEQQLTMF